MSTPGMGHLMRSPHPIPQAKDEVAIMSKLFHPNIIQIYGARPARTPVCSPSITLTWPFTIVAL